MEGVAVFDLLRKANDRGEIGYVWGGDNIDLPAVRECEGRGWITYHRDASPGIGAKYYGQRRDIYLITDAGRKALALHDLPNTEPK